MKRLPPQKPRIETGPVKFGDDWCGMFFRGDNCAGHADRLNIVARGIENEAYAVYLKQLARMFAMADETTTPAQIQS